MACHSFGRLIYSVNTLISNPEISKIHAVVEWVAPNWFIRDISKNGIWINKERITANKSHRLKIGDVIQMARRNGIAFEVTNLDEPRDYLLPYLIKDREFHASIPLTDYMLLPDESDPEIIVFFDSEKVAWFYEYVKHDKPKVEPLHEDKTINFNNIQWLYRPNYIEANTRQLLESQLNLKDLYFQFEVSQDEEKVKVVFYGDERKYDLKLRTHHYLTLLLARRRAEDIRSGFEEASQGWIYTEQLADDLGIDVSHLNIQVHRVRKQFADQADNVINSENVIERRPGEVRFAGSQFKILKGNSLEYSTYKNKKVPS